MQTVLTERGQISVPAEIRRKYRLKPGMGMEWIEREEGIFLMPVPLDPIAAFRGKGKTSVKDLLDQRKKDRKREGLPR